MTPDQRRRLAEVSGRLAEVAIADADPDNWSGAGQTLAEMDKETRGNAAWCRKTAVQTVALLVRLDALTASSGPAGDDSDPEAEIRRAEKAAAKALDRVLGAEANARR